MPGDRNTITRGIPRLTTPGAVADLSRKAEETGNKLETIDNFYGDPDTGGGGSGLSPSERALLYSRGVRLGTVSEVLSEAAARVSLASGGSVVALSYASRILRVGDLVSLSYQVGSTTDLIIDGVRGA